MNNNFYNIMYLLKITGKIEGRKKFQKIVFILQQLGINFSEDFVYHYFGPYSSDLQLEIDYLVKNNIVVEKSENPFLYMLNDSFDVSLPKTQLLKNKKLVKELNSMSANLLEVLATIFYLFEYETEKKSEIKKKLNYLKPHLAKHFNMAFDLFSELKKKTIYN